MRVRFSTFFKRELLDAESRYAAISEALGKEFHERVKETARTIAQRKGEITSARMAFRANAAARFRFSSTTRLRAMTFTCWASSTLADIRNS